MNDQEFKAVLALPASARYTHFIKQVADTETVWSLGADDGWVLSGDDEGHEFVPAWPHESYAAACALGEWAGNQPRPISLDQWLDVWLPGVARDHRLITVFPTPAATGSLVTPERLVKDLREELENYL